MITKTEFVSQVKEQIYPLIDRKREAQVFRICTWGAVGIFFFLFCLMLYLNILYPATSAAGDDDRILGLIIGPLGVAILVSAIMWKSYMRYTKKKLRPTVFNLLNATSVSEQKVSGLTIEQLRHLCFLPQSGWRDRDTVQQDCLSLWDEKVPFYAQEVSFSSGIFAPDYIQGPIVRFFLPQKSDLTLMVIKKDTLFPTDRAIMKTPEMQKTLSVAEEWQPFPIKEKKDVFLSFTNNPKEARKVLSQRFWKQIDELETLYRAPVNFLFYQDQLLLFIQTNEDLFEFFTESRLIQSYEKFYDEIVALYNFQKSFRSK
ncbi:MAG: DUF3137 domain-containing protein [Pseudomonadota bacterium]|nr:DUF3137 domain-containing protein [Pseudomonadota bacterium]